MERWKEVFNGMIPQDVYQVIAINGEEKGLILKLKSHYHCIILSFGMIQAIRMLDEGIVQTELYDNEEIARLRKSDFRNVIYEVQGGQFEKEMKKIAGGYWDALEIKHYVVITQNFNIDILTEWEPEIKFEDIEM